jgi:hypothetical protein
MIMRMVVVGLSTRIVVLIIWVAKLKTETQVCLAITDRKEAFPDPLAQILTISWRLLWRNASYVRLKEQDEVFIFFLLLL